MRGPLSKSNRLMSSRQGAKPPSPGGRGRNQVPFKIMNTTTKTKLDWVPVISSLLHKLQRADFAIIRTDDGGDVQRYDPDGGELAIRRKAARHLAEVDEGWLTVLDLQHSPRTEARKLQLFIVLGNGPEEIVCDYACDARLDKVIDAHCDQWEGVAVPRTEY